MFVSFSLFCYPVHAYFLACLSNSFPFIKVFKKCFHKSKAFLTDVPYHVPFDHFLSDKNKVSVSVLWWFLVRMLHFPRIHGLSLPVFHYYREPDDGSCNDFLCQQDSIILFFFLDFKGGKQVVILIILNILSTTKSDEVW